MASLTCRSGDVVRSCHCNGTEYITITRAEATDMAKKLRIDGKGLYEILPEQWYLLYDVQGQTIYNHLQENVASYLKVLNGLNLLGFTVYALF